MLASAEIVGMKAFWKKTDSTLVSFHGVALVLILEFLLSFALSGVNRASIDDQVQQRCLPKTSRRHD